MSLFIDTVLFLSVAIPRRHNLTLTLCLKEWRNSTSWFYNYFLFELHVLATSVVPRVGSLQSFIGSVIWYNSLSMMLSCRVKLIRKSIDIAKTNRMHALKAVCCYWSEKAVVCNWKLTSFGTCFVSCIASLWKSLLNILPYSHYYRLGQYLKKLILLINSISVRSLTLR